MLFDEPSVKLLQLTSPDCIEAGTKRRGVEGWVGVGWREGVFRTSAKLLQLRLALLKPEGQASTGTKCRRRTALNGCVLHGPIQVHGVLLLVSQFRSCVMVEVAVLGTFRHLPPNSARLSYATEGALFISAQLSTDAVSVLRKVWVLIRLWKQPSAQART